MKEDSSGGATEGGGGRWARLLDVASAAVFAFSMFGLLALIFSNGLPDNLLSRGFHGLYFGVLGFNYRGYYGVQAAEWLVIMLFSFATIDRHAGPTNTLMHTLLFASALGTLYETGLLLIMPGFSSEWVMQWQHGTSLQWFSNLDLLMLSMAVLTVLVAIWFSARSPRSALAG